jgi:trk system potassium uptake protein TrkH
VLLAVGSLVIVLSLLGTNIATTTGETTSASAGPAVRHGIFTTVSIATTTGYCTADFNGWPFLAKAVLIGLMFIGGSAGSTAGGFKVIRLWVALKVMLSEIEHVFRPSVVRPVRVGKSIVDDQLKLGTVSYVLGFVALFALGSVAVMLLEQLNPGSTCDYTTAASASVASLCTIGPGLAKVGAIENYGWMADSSVRRAQAAKHACLELASQIGAEKEEEGESPPGVVLVGLGVRFRRHYGHGRPRRGRR